MKLYPIILILLPIFSFSQANSNLNLRVDSVKNHFKAKLDKNFISENYNADLLWEYFMIYPNNEFFFDSTIVPTFINKFIDDKGQVEKMFPFNSIDSAVKYSVSFNEDVIPNSIDWEYFVKTAGYIKINPGMKIKSTNKLSSKTLNEILKFVNMPSNFDFGECGTRITEELVLFYKNGKSIAAIEVCCNKGQIISYPANYRSKFGAIKSDKLNEFTHFLKN